MVLQQTLPIPQETAIASYDYVDVSEGSGVIIFLGASHKEETTPGFFLSRNATYSNTVTSRAFTLIGNQDFNKLIDHDYDITFNLPKRLKGIIRCILSIGGGDIGSPNTSLEVYAIIRARHWDGTTETDLASGQTETKAIAANVNDSKTMNVEIDVTAGRHFKKGDTLRLTVEIWAKRVGSVTAPAGYGHDPKDRNAESVGSESQVVLDEHTTILEFHIPFRLNI